MSTDFPGDDRDADATGTPNRRRRRTTLALLVLPTLATLAVPLYARDEPRLSGVPFFYWYQFVCVLLTALCLAAALALGRHDGARHRTGAGGDSW